MLGAQSHSHPMRSPNASGKATFEAKFQHKWIQMGQSLTKNHGVPQTEHKSVRFPRTWEVGILLNRIQHVTPVGQRKKTESSMTLTTQKSKTHRNRH